MMGFTDRWFARPRRSVNKGAIDEIRLGPIRLELRETAVAGEHCVVVHTKSSGTHGMGTPTTLEEWHETLRFAGIEGMNDRIQPEPKNVDAGFAKGGKARSIS